MEYEWDEVKRLANLQKHKVDFYAIYDFDRNTAQVKYSERYGEARWPATGYFTDALLFVVFTFRGNKIRIISLRRTKAEERDEYAGH